MILPMEESHDALRDREANPTVDRGEVASVGVLRRISAVAALYGVVGAPGGTLAELADVAILIDALSYEPYAIALPRGDWAMKQAVDSALAQIYRSSALPELYGRWFGALGPPSPAIELMFALGCLPE